LLYDVIIIGGASAGLTSAIYTSRQDLKTLVITKDIGGQALLTNDIQNYPGFKTISGFDLATSFEEQVKAFGAEFVYDEVVQVSPADDCPDKCFRARTKTDKQFEALAVIFAFGKTPRDLGVPGEDRLKGRGVSYCAVCDGPLFKKKRVGVVGSADQAVEASLLLSDLAERVHLTFPREMLLADDESIERLRSRANVELLPNTKVAKITGESKVESMVLEKIATKEMTTLKVDGVFVEIGYVAKTAFIKDLVQLNGRGEVIVDKDCATSTRGIFAAGDVTDVAYKQAVISAGQGAIAALSAYNYIQRLRGKPAVRADWKVKPLAAK